MKLLSIGRTGKSDLIREARPPRESRNASAGSSTEGRGNGSGTETVGRMTGAGTKTGVGVGGTGLGVGDAVGLGTAVGEGVKETGAAVPGAAAVGADCLSSAHAAANRMAANREAIAVDFGISDHRCMSMDRRGGFTLATVIARVNGESPGTA